MWNTALLKIEFQVIILSWGIIVCVSMESIVLKSIAHIEHLVTCGPCPSGRVTVHSYKRPKKPPWLWTKMFISFRNGPTARLRVALCHQLFIPVSLQNRVCKIYTLLRAAIERSIAWNFVPFLLRFSQRDLEKWWMDYLIHSRVRTAFKSHTAQTSGIYMVWTPHRGFNIPDFSRTMR